MATYALIHGAYGCGTLWSPFAAELDGAHLAQLTRPAELADVLGA